MIVNKFPFSKNPSFSDTNQLLDEEIFQETSKNDIEINLQTENLSEESNKIISDNDPNQSEKSFVKRIIKIIKKNCCLYVFTLTIITIIMLIYVK